MCATTKTFRRLLHTVTHAPTTLQLTGSKILIELWLKMLLRQWSTDQWLCKSAAVAAAAEYNNNNNSKRCSHSQSIAIFGQQWVRAFCCCCWLRWQRQSGTWHASMNTHTHTHTYALSYTCTRTVNGKDACRCNAVTITVKLYSCKYIWFLLFVVLLLLLLSVLPLLLLVASLCRVFRKDMHALPFLAPKQMPRTTCSRKAISYNGTCSAFVYTICIRMFHSIYKSMHKFPKVVVEFFKIFFFFLYFFFSVEKLCFASSVFSLCVAIIFILSPLCGIIHFTNTSCGGPLSLMCAYFAYSHENVARYCMRSGFKANFCMHQEQQQQVITCVHMHPYLHILYTWLRPVKHLFHRCYSICAQKLWMDVWNIAQII